MLCILLLLATLATLSACARRPFLLFLFFGITLFFGASCGSMNCVAFEKTATGKIVWVVAQVMHTTLSRPVAETEKLCEQFMTAACSCSMVPV